MYAFNPFTMSENETTPPENTSSEENKPVDSGAPNAAGEQAPPPESNPEITPIEPMKTEPAASDPAPAQPAAQGSQPAAAPPPITPSHQAQHTQPQQQAYQQQAPQQPQQNPYAQSTPGPGQQGAQGPQQPVYNEFYGARGYVPPGQGYAPQPHQAQMAQRPLPNATGVLVCGIIAIPFLGLIGIILAIISLSMASSAERVYAQNPQIYTRSSYNNMKAGRVCAIIALILSLVFIPVYLAIVLG